MRCIRRYIGKHFLRAEDKNFEKSLNIEDDQDQENYRTHGLGHLINNDLLTECTVHAYSIAEDDGLLYQYYFWKHYWIRVFMIYIKFIFDSIGL